jgi:5'(3')-deoxyribonucleotidase
MKKILYFDMDGVLVDFQFGIDQLTEETMAEYEGQLDNVPGLFGLMKPVNGAIEAFETLSEHYDVYILSTAPWGNPSAWRDKLEWVQKYLGETAKKRLILSHNKHLNKGDFLIDDRLKNGSERFEGELIQFGSEHFPNWEKVKSYLLGI